MAEFLTRMLPDPTAKHDTSADREGFAELRRAFPDMPEFKVHVVQHWSGVAN